MPKLQHEQGPETIAVVPPVALMLLPKTAQGLRPSLVESMAALLGGTLLPVASADSETGVDYQGLVDWKQGASMVMRYLMTAVYLFGHNPNACKAPVIIDPGP